MSNNYTKKFVIWLTIIIILLAVVFTLIGFYVGVYWQMERDKREEIKEHLNFNDLFLVARLPVYIPEVKSLATITAYTPTKEECDDTPNIMASGNKVYLGAIACPREIPFGTIVEIDGKEYVCEDRTSKKYDGRFDILMFSKKEALNFGKQVKEIVVY